MAFPCPGLAAKSAVAQQAARSTGHTRNAIVHNNVLDAEVHLLARPFTLEALSHELQELLRTDDAR
jgi:hypothetical protein